MKRYMIFLGIMMLLFTGCGESDADTYEEVSAEFRPFTEGSGLTKEKWKESGVVYEDRVMEFQDPVIEEMLRNMIGKLEGMFISATCRIFMQFIGGIMHMSQLDIGQTCSQRMALYHVEKV